MDSDNCMTDCGYQLVEDLSYKGNPVYTKPVDNSSMSIEEALVEESSTMGPPPPMERTDVVTEASPMSTPPPMERTDVTTEVSPDSSSPFREMGGRKSRRIRGKKSRKSRKYKKRTMH